MKMAIRDGTVILADVSPRSDYFTAIHSWGLMGWSRQRQCFFGPATAELLNHLADLLQGRLPPQAEELRQRLNRVDEAVDAQRMAEVQSQKATGIYAFKRKLKAKGISDEDAEAALAAFDDKQQQAACLAAAEKLVRKYAELPRREARAKLGQALARRGFDWDAIESTVNQLMD